MEEIKVGTVLIIDNEFIEKLEAAVEAEEITIREHEEFCTYTYTEWIPTKIKFKETRIDRMGSYLTWYHLNDDLANVENFTLTVFEKLGYTIIKPEQHEIPLCDAPDDLLSDRELVHKHFIKKCSSLSKFESWSKGVLNMIEKVMDEHGIVFYKP
jgi:hypothetical protein